MMKMTDWHDDAVVDAVTSLIAAAAEGTKDAAVESWTGRRRRRLISVPVSLSSVTERIKQQLNSSLLKHGSRKAKRDTVNKNK